MLTFMSKKKIALTLWIACLAILLAALAPPLARLLAASNGAGANNSIEICTVAGMRYVSLDQAGPDKAPAAPAMAMDDCPYCTLHADVPALPPSIPLMLAIDTRTGILPTLFYQARRPLFAWAPAQSRAPPAIS